MLTQPLFTIQLAIHRPPHLLPFAVASVLAQTLTDFELVIICDGAPKETIAQARLLSDQDNRIQVRAFPKGARRGEEHRAEVLRTARGRYVAHIADDDLWFPDHLTVLARGLRRFDFCHTVQVTVLPASKHNWMIAPSDDLGIAEHRRAVAEGKRNFFGPTVTGYRLDAYRQLSVGWSPAPEGAYSDLFMWQKFLAEPWLRAGTIRWPTAVSLPNSLRSEDAMAERLSEAKCFAEAMRHPRARTALRWKMVTAIARSSSLRSYPELLRRHPLAGSPLLALKVCDSLLRRLRDRRLGLTRRSG